MGKILLILATISYFSIILFGATLVNYFILRKLLIQIICPPAEGIFKHGKDNMCVIDAVNRYAIIEWMGRTDKVINYTKSKYKTDLKNNVPIKGE